MPINKVLNHLLAKSTIKDRQWDYLNFHSKEDGNDGFRTSQNR